MRKRSETWVEFEMQPGWAVPYLYWRTTLHQTLTGNYYIRWWRRVN